MRWALRLLSVLALSAAAVQLATAAYIPTKALLAQWLLQHAWRQSEHATVAAKPWPWADTHPVARLQVSRLGVDQIVLAGDQGRTLAFGPGWVEASAAPGSGGYTIIGGHRDTHFRFLRDLKLGDEISVQAPGGRIERFVIDHTEVADATQARLVLEQAPGLTLVTCYPFDALEAGGPLRYLVSARPLEQRIF